MTPEKNLSKVKELNQSKKRKALKKKYPDMKFLFMDVSTSHVAL